MNDSTTAPTLVALFDRFVRFYRRHGCRIEDAQDLAGDLIVQVVSGRGSMQFLHRQSTWIIEHGIPRPYFRQAYRLLDRFRQRNERLTDVPADLVAEPGRVAASAWLGVFAESLRAPERRAFEHLRAGYTRSEVAAMIGVSDRTIRKWLVKWQAIAKSYEEN